MLPKVRGTNGAWAADGGATATATATGAGAVSLMVGVAAEAGSVREATMAPEITITAEALLAGFAECEIADERDEAELKGLGARWRPVFRLDTVRKPLHTPARSAVGFGWEIASGPHPGRSTEVVHHREGFTPRSVSRRPRCGSPAPAKRMLRALNAVTGLGEPHQVLRPKMTKPDDHTHAVPTCHISVADHEVADQESETGLPFGHGPPPLHPPCVRLPRPLRKVAARDTISS